MNKHNNYVVLASVSFVIVSIFVCVFFVVSIISTSKNKDDTKSKDTIGQPCSDRKATNILNDASVALDPAYPENIRNLDQISGAILSYEKYQEDTNCLNILTMKYVYASDYSNAKKYLDLLVQKQNAEVNVELPQNFLPVEELKNSVEFLDRKIKEIEQNNPYGPAI